MSTKEQAIITDVNAVLLGSEPCAATMTPGDGEPQEIVDKTCPVSGYTCALPACASGGCAMRLVEVVGPDSVFTLQSPAA